MSRLTTAALMIALAACSAAPPAAPWVTLFDGSLPGADLGAFESSGFGGDGEITVEHGAIHLGMGSPLTGITWTGAPPAGDYELEVRAARLAGNDFFCGLTFPVGQEHLTLVLGGWGGAVCGLSCLDGQDASRNPTRTLRHFETDRDYVVTIRVQGSRIDVEIDGQPFLGADVRGRQLTLRPEVELSLPLGIASFATEAAVRTVRWRSL